MFVSSVLFFLCFSFFATHILCCWFMGPTLVPLGQKRYLGHVLAPSWAWGLLGPNWIKKTLNHLEEILKSYNASINCSSLHPFAKGKNQIISNDSRYKRIMKDLQIIGTRFITQGLHVHIGIDDCEKVIKVNNGLRIYLPLLLALTTSSPFYEGIDTGLYSYRTKIFESFISNILCR